MNTYLVTGGAGFIGSSVTEKLIKLGFKVVIIDNFCDFYNPELKRKNIEDLKKLVNLKNQVSEMVNNSENSDNEKINNNELIRVYEGDIRDKIFLKKVFDENQIDMVIHLAAMAGVRPSIKNPSLYVEVNCIGTQNLLDEMKEHNLTKLVMASSSSVYGNCKQVPFKEDMIVDYAISPYAATKKSNEVMAHVYHKLFDINVIMLRFFTVYGPKQRPDLAINKFVRLMLNNEEIPMYGDGTTSRDYTYIDDIVDGVVKSCDYVDVNSNVYEIINLGNSSPIYLTDMINTIAQVLNVTPKIKQLPMQPGDVETTFADITKAKRLLGWEPKVKFKDGISETFGDGLDLFQI